MILKHKLDGLTSKKLSRLHDAPKELYYRGANPNDLLSRPVVAIVGSRKMSPYGRAVTEMLTNDLVRAGVVVISGLALGVDSAAHRAVVDAGGTTIAVLAGGLDIIYPNSHAGLAESIVQTGGTLLSEYPTGMPALKHTFIGRNRIIAALSDAVLIPEAAINSGSLHTAAFALDMGLPVLAVPGPITSQLSSGTNQLIKTGAMPVTNADDIFHALNLEKSVVQQSLLPANDQETSILEALKDGASDGMTLLTASGLRGTLFTQTLTMLEINGRIRSLGGDMWALVN